MKRTVKLLLLLSVITFTLSNVRAQEKIFGEGRYQHTRSDSLITLFYNKLYRSFYNPSYMSTVIATVAVVKVDIDNNGKVIDIILSDSADPNFKKAFNARRNASDDYPNLQEYAALKHYTNVSLLVPVYFEPGYPKQKKVFSYEELEGLWKFDGKNITGVFFGMSPIFIRVGSSGNM